MTQIQISFHAISRYVAFSMLVRVQRTWVNVNIRIEFLNSDFVTSRLEQFSY